MGFSAARVAVGGGGGGEGSGGKITPSKTR